MNPAKLLLPIALLSASAGRATDNRIQTMAFNPQGIVRVVGRPGIQSTVQFASDERIENVAVGDSSVWEVTPNHRASMIFLKPLAGAHRTNMTVVTDRRTYMFDLIPALRHQAPVYSLRFTYTDLRPSAAQLADKAAEAPVAPLVAATAPEKLNFDWSMKGTASLLPRRAFDDGTSLFLSWSRTVSLPAILTPSADGHEGPINYRVAGDYIVIDAIPSSIILRQGNKTATLWPTRGAAAPPPQATRMPGRDMPAPKSSARTAANMIVMPDLTALATDLLTDHHHGE